MSVGNSNDSTLSPERMMEILEQEVIASGDGETVRRVAEQTRRRFLAGALGGAAGIAAMSAAQQAKSQDGGLARIMVVYTTDTNTTRRVAERVISGVNSVAEAVPYLLETGREISREDMLACDGLIMGTPVRHRTMHHRVKVFVEDVLEKLWLDDAMVGMVGATFSVGGGHGDAGAGAEMCQLSMLSAMAANGMVLVTLPKSTPGGDHACLHWGPAVRTGGPKMEPIWPTASALDCAFHHGANVARIASHLKQATEPLHASGNVSPTPELVAAFQAGASTMETADQVPPADANPAYRSETDADFPSGDGFKVKG